MAVILLPGNPLEHPERLQIHFHVDAGYKRLQGEGIKFDEPPEDKPWGWRHAYAHGPHRGDSLPVAERSLREVGGSRGRSAVIGDFQFVPRPDESEFVSTQQKKLPTKKNRNRRGERARPETIVAAWLAGRRADLGQSSGAAGRSGCRVIAPFLRGFGPTRFLHASTRRTGQPTALACDAGQLLDALEMPCVTVVGHDWGAWTAYVLAGLWPERVERLITLAVGYEIGIKSGAQLNYEQHRAYWYQWFFASERGVEALRDNRRELCDFLWRTWSPTWRFTESEFTETAHSWENPDWVEVTLHSYRVRWGNAAVDPRFGDLEERMKGQPSITVPTVQLHLPKTAPRWLML
jgi:pimeloyl-ACP methyl ester carboxylesterase